VVLIEQIFEFSTVCNLAVTTCSLKFNDYNRFQFFKSNLALVILFFHIYQFKKSYDMCNFIIFPKYFFDWYIYWN